MISGRTWKDFVALATAIVAVAFTAFQLWISAAGVLASFQRCYIHLAFAFVIIYLTKPIFSEDSRFAKLRWFIDGPLILASITIAVYSTVNFLEIAERGGGDPTEMSVWLGGIVTIMVIDATRRVAGWALPIIAMTFLAYAMLGPHLPGILAHRGYDIDRIVTTLYVTASGIAGTPLQVSSSYVAIFIIFAAFLDKSGAGKFFIDWSFAGLGWMRGGPAKVAVFASALMGTISGSAVANVAATGAFTIPVMKRAGMRPSFAGAVEAAASSGGQIMPPVMGAAAFIMVEIMGTSYNSIMKAALIPGILYFVAVLSMVDFEVAKNGIKGIPRAQLPDAFKIFRAGWHLLIPLALLMVLLVVIEYTPVKSAFLALVATVVVSWFRTHTRMKLKALWEAFERGGKAMVEIAAACATAGIVVGIMLLTGLAGRFAEILVASSGGNLFVLLVMVMVISIFLGMGLPTSAVYVLLATMVAPALIKLHVEPMAAHMFIFYFGVLANVTPPVAIAAYAGAGIAQANVHRTGITAFKIAFAGFLLPFMWVYNPALIMQGDSVRIALAVVTALIGVVSLAAGTHGYLMGGFARWWERLLLIAGAFTLIVPGIITDGVGLVLIGLALVSRYTLSRPATIVRRSIINEDVGGTS